MTIISVTRDPAGNSGLISIDADEILMLEYSSKEDRIILHTTDHSFFTMGTLKYWTDALNGTGYKYALVDRGNSLNLEKVVLLDKTYNLAFFESDIHSQSKRCMIASQRFKEVECSLNILNPAIIVT